MCMEKIMIWKKRSNIVSNLGKLLSPALSISLAIAAYNIHFNTRFLFSMNTLRVISVFYGSTSSTNFQRITFDLVHNKKLNKADAVKRHVSIVANQGTFWPIVQIEVIIYKQLETLYWSPAMVFVSNAALLSTMYARA
ncbi:hypothetical protein DICVIV_09158 [Dictyocaulus viviparus]|uniref:Uncharacterized protein n=1 Tax=Dictyocaulus viviparus TaxID=29172 RepID=A0A0D8XM47_DICVI|nr:hypothetical protein DICVIV_09158 [Dictyocaulus viviparus]